jgi:nucleoid-associated protein YgaU
VDGSTHAPSRRTLTPAVLGSAAFAVACAALAITFVAARGGLQMPVAATAPALALASPGASATVPLPSLMPTIAPSTGPTIQPSPASTDALPSAEPSAAAASGGPPTLEPSDPLLRLPQCPDLPGCFEYTIQRGDSLTGVASRYLIPVSTVLALNPEITDPSVVVVGHVLYLGRDPFVRLPACDGVPDCSLYTVRAGDRLSTIAGRFGITLEAILAANPSITDPNVISTGQVVRLPHPAA